MSFTLNSLNNSLIIGGSEDDPFYRYKMPRITITHQRKSGGTTVVNNTTIVCSSLDRDAKHIAKYLSKELGRPVGLKNGCWTMHGVVNTRVIQDSILKYISAYVLCGVCGNPETVMGIGSKQLTCKSCGNKTKL